ncbi:MAG: transporter substrate-binding domain-containing protein [Desulfatibacillaceae bacterium]|nr:transporter substrate-binding domain-containing protein [Desulfatibacillaceae bacterium]
MKTFWFYKTILLSIALAIAGSASAHARPMEEIEKSGELRFCIVRANQQEYEFYCKLAEAFADHVNPSLKVVIHGVDQWDILFQDEDGNTRRGEGYTPKLLADGTCDSIAAPITRMPWREKLMGLINLFPSRTVVVVRKAQAQDYTLERNLAGKKAAVLKSSSFQSWLESQNQTRYLDNPVSMVLVPTLIEAREKVLVGEADFTLMDADGAMAIITQEYPSLAVAFPVGDLESIGWGFCRDDTGLQDAAREFFRLQIADSDSTFNRLWKERYGMTLVEFAQSMTIGR